MASHQPARVLLWLVTALTIFGLIAVASASSVISSEQFGDEFAMFKHQLLFGLGPGLIAFLLLRRLPLRWLRAATLPIFLLAIVLLGLVFVPDLGFSYGGARRWLDLGFFSFQPSEFAKIALIIYLAAWLEKIGPRLDRWRESFLPFLLIIGVPGLLILLEPDVGTLAVFGLASALVYFMAGAPLKYLAALGVGALIVLGTIVTLSSERSERVVTFLNPQYDTLDAGYQVNQSLLAIGSGGIFGRGLGQSRQKYSYLPQPAGDSIFAIIGEELGFIAAGALVVIYLLLAHQGLRLAQQAATPFGRFLIIGIIAVVLVQAFVNIAAVTGLMPFTGVPLPFISYGGTALAVMLGAFGLVLNVSRQGR